MISPCNCMCFYVPAGRNDLPFAHEDFLAMDSNELSEDRGHGEGHNVELPPREMLDRSKESAHKEKQVRQAKPPERTTTDAPKRAGENEEPDNLNDVKERDLRQPGPVPPAPEQRDNPWAKGKAPLAGLSVAARSMLTDDSKAVRSKALACCLRILHAHGESLGSEGVECSRFHPGPSREGMVAALADVSDIWLRDHFSLCACSVDLVEGSLRRDCKCMTRTTATKKCFCKD